MIHEFLPLAGFAGGVGHELRNLWLHRCNILTS
jgi:hypothetical protein